MVVPRNFLLLLLAELLVLEFPLRRFPWPILCLWILLLPKEIRFYDPLRPTQAQTLFIMEISGKKLMKKYSIEESRSVVVVSASALIIIKREI